jgi:hypothetical protein
VNGDGVPEVISLASLSHDPPPQRTRFIPGGVWPQVYRLRDGKYVEASRDFPGLYDKTVFPLINKAIAKAPEEQSPARYLAALTMCRDKILRVLGRDPNAGLAKAREWMSSPDPVLVDDARVVFIDIGGHDDEANAAKLATERASKNWPSKSW